MFSYVMDLDLKLRSSIDNGVVGNSFEYPASFTVYRRWERPSSIWNPETSHFIGAVAFYIAINLLYSFKLKEIVLLDVFIIAAGFMLRVLGGAFAIGVQVSSWLVLCSLFISLFLGFAKRRGELLLLREGGVTPERRVLRLYVVGFLDQMLTIAAAGAVCYYGMNEVPSHILVRPDALPGFVIRK